MTRLTLAITGALLPAVLAGAAAQESAAPKKEPQANLCTRGKLLFSEDFSAKELSKEWKVAKGKWEVVDGALKGSEVASDQHAAVIKHALGSRNFVLQFSFKFEGAKSAAVSFDGKGHVCRVRLAAAGFTLQRDVAKDSGEKPTVLGKGACEFKAGEWHTMLVEAQGKEMLAQVEDKVFAFGEHAGVDQDKATFGFPVSGESFVVKDIRVWEGQPNPDWSIRKSKLAQNR